MLSAMVLNGLTIWIMSMINWGKRLWYAAHQAIEVTGTCVMANTGKKNATNTFKGFRIDYEGQEHTVNIAEMGYDFSKLSNGSKEELLWIPGKKRAMISRYRWDEDSRKILRICDLVSLLALIPLILSCVMIGNASKWASDNYHTVMIISEVCFFGAIALMIASSVIRKKQKK